MPQLHFYLPSEIADQLKQRAELKGVTTSAYIAEIVKLEMQDSWPPGYLESVIGATKDAPIERSPAEGWDQRDAFE
jgi:hypothetical protein